MLHTLSIKNYALIEDISIVLPKGFTIITGETGAGKSILLGALSLLLGKRADYGILKDKHKKCIVEGNFDISSREMAGFFASNDLDYDDMTIIRREIIPSGKSRAFINDTPVNLDILRSFANQLIDIHSQHQMLELSRAKFQLEVLDDFADNHKLTNTYEKAYNEYRLLEKKLIRLKSENEKAKRDEDYIRFQYEELKAAELKISEVESLIEREKFLAHAGEVAQGIEMINQLLSEAEQPVVVKLTEALESLLKISEYHPNIDELLRRLDSATIEIKDIALEVSRLEGQTDINPDELLQITERLDIIYRLQQKHQVDSVDGLLSTQANYLASLDGIGDRGDEVIKIEGQLEKSKSAARELADELHKKRKVESYNFASSVFELLTQLGMKDAIFNVEVEQLENLVSNGKDKIRFIFNANKGGEAKEISQIASGGELSRLILSIKSLINKENLLPTVIFDEIDAGVSGEIAGKVGNILKEMSLRHQLIAITHLPQIAAKADNHFRVFKTIENGQTQTLINKLDEEGRVDEIAKLLSDEKVTTAAVNTAKELLSIAT